MVLSESKDRLSQRVEPVPTETTKITPLHVEVRASLKADLDRADGLVWMEQVELMGKRGPIGGPRIGLGWESEPGMQVATDAHNFGGRTEVHPLLREIVSHPAITISPPLDRLLRALIKAKQVPIVLRGQNVLNECKHLSVPSTISQRMRKKIRHNAVLRDSPAFERLAVMARNFQGETTIACCCQTRQQREHQARHLLCAMKFPEEEDLTGSCHLDQGAPHLCGKFIRNKCVHDLSSLRSRMRLLGAYRFLSHVQGVSFDLDPPW
jgi:hypothetical protein